MSEQKHTPGPWEVKMWQVRDGDGIYRADVRAPMRDDYIVAATECSFKKAEHVFVCTNIAMAQEEYTANARLIAAAPDLLAACKLAHAQFLQGSASNVERIKREDELEAILNDAILKAEGTDVPA